MQKRKKTWCLAQGLLSCLNLHQKKWWLPARPLLTLWSLDEPQTTLSQRKCAEVYFSQELTLAAKQAHQVALDSLTHKWLPCVFLVHTGVLFCYNLQIQWMFCRWGEKKPMESLLLYLKKKKSVEQERMWLHFYLWSISLDEYAVNVAETVTKQSTMSQEILLNSVISFSESSFSVWRWRKQITFYIHLNWKGAECGSW